MTTLTEQWPLFGLTLRTPRLTLQYVDDERAAALMALAAQAGVHDPGAMPFDIPWTRAASPALEQQGLQFYWRTRAETTAASWRLPLAVSFDGRLVGVQEVFAIGFPVRRTVATGSWLARDAQGQGIGKEMRSAVLQLAFAGLGAERAESSAFADNPASMGVSRALGYTDNGTEVRDREGRPALQRRFTLPREHFRPLVETTVVGLAPCLPLLGLAAS